MVSKRSQQLLEVKSVELQKSDFCGGTILMVGLTGFPATPAQCDYVWKHRADRFPRELREQLGSAGS